MLRLLHKMIWPLETTVQIRLEYLPAEQLVDLQWKKLRRLLSAAYQRVPFYQRRFKEIGATPDDIRTPGDFAKFPLLTRDDILDNLDDMVACAPERLRKKRSGGSTGTPLYFYINHEYKYYKMALWERFLQHVGARGLRPALYLWGTTVQTDVPGDLRAGQRLTQPFYHYGIRSLTPEVLAGIAGDLRIIKPAVLIGYASLLLALARYVLENRIPMEHPPQRVISTAETLFPEDRRVMEAGLNAPVYNFYGSSENPHMAGECLERRGLHVAIDHVYLEILAGERPAMPGEPGYFVVTDLDNLAMPFIRYRNDDVGTWSPESCPCGRNLPMLSSIYGRHTDFIFDCDGTVYPGINLLRPIRPVAAGGRIRQYQLRQNEPGRLEVLAVPGMPPDGNLEADLRRALNDEFKGRMEIVVAWVESIPPEPSGKTRFTKSAIPFSAIWGTKDE